MLFLRVSISLWFVFKYFSSFLLIFVMNLGFISVILLFVRILYLLVICMFSLKKFLSVIIVIFEFFCMI